MRTSTEAASPGARALAWAVHLYTASGAVIALGALVATVEGEARAAFLWMAAALFIDATDGALARAARVKQVVPAFDGARLDDIVDYLNYVVVPVFFAWHFDMLPAAGAGAIAAAPLLASAYGFCQVDAKTPDHMFTGFPSYWNVAVYYLFALDMPPAVNAAVLVLFSVLVFVPIRYVYPSRNPFLRRATVTAGGVWGVTLIATFFQLPEPDRAIVWASLAFPAWYFALSFYLHFRNPVPSRASNP